MVVECNIMKVVTLVVQLLLLLTIVSTTTRTTTTIDATAVDADAAATSASGAADTKADRIDVGAIIIAGAASNTPLRRKIQQQKEGEEGREMSSSPTTVCPIEMLDPSNTKCDITSQEGKVCGYEHVWVGGAGCSTVDNELECQPSLICTCNLFYDEYWACAAENMSSSSFITTCPDDIGTVASSKLRGTMCTPEGSIEIVQQQQQKPQQQQDGDGAATAATERPTRTDTTNANSDSDIDHDDNDDIDDDDDDDDDLDYLDDLFRTTTDDVADAPQIESEIDKIMSNTKSEIIQINSEIAIPTVTTTDDDTDDVADAPQIESEIDKIMSNTKSEIIQINSEIAIPTVTTTDDDEPPAVEQTEIDEYEDEDEDEDDDDLEYLDDFFKNIDDVDDVESESEQVAQIESEIDEIMSEVDSKVAQIKSEIASTTTVDEPTVDGDDDDIDDDDDLEYVDDLFKNIDESESEYEVGSEIAAITATTDDEPTVEPTRMVADDDDDLQYLDDLFIDGDEGPTVEPTRMVADDDDDLQYLDDLFTNDEVEVEVKVDVDVVDNDDNDDNDESNSNPSSPTPTFSPTSSPTQLPKTEITDESRTPTSTKGSMTEDEIKFTAIGGSISFLVVSFIICGCLYYMKYFHCPRTKQKRDKRNGAIALFYQQETAADDERDALNLNKQALDNFHDEEDDNNNMVREFGSSSIARSNAYRVLELANKRDVLLPYKSSGGSKSLSSFTGTTARSSDNSNVTLGYQSHRDRNSDSTTDNARSNGYRGIGRTTSGINGNININSNISNNNNERKILENLRRSEEILAQQAEVRDQQEQHSHTGGGASSSQHRRRRRRHSSITLKSTSASSAGTGTVMDNNDMLDLGSSMVDVDFDSSIGSLGYYKDGYDDF